LSLKFTEFIFEYGQSLSKVNKAGISGFLTGWLLFLIMIMILETTRLSLSQFEPGDEKLLFDLNKDWAVVKYTGNQPMKDLDEALAVLHQNIFPQYEAGFGRWAVYLKSNQEFLGWCGLKKHDGHIDLGYRFFAKHWGKGYATESAKAVLNYAFTNLALQEVIAHAAIENVSSLHVLEKIGMHRVGEGVEDGIRVYAYRITKEEWDTGN